MGTKVSSKTRAENLKAGYPTKDPSTKKVTVSAKAPKTSRRGSKRVSPGKAMRAHDASAIQERLRIEKELGITRGSGS